MKEVYGSTWTLELMLGFILLFVAFLTLTINYSKVFKMKNDILSIIEKYGGYNDTSKEIIDNYLETSGYKTIGTCNADADQSVGILNRQLEKLNNGKKYNYCITREKAESDNVTNINFEVIMFFKFNIPIIGDIATFKVDGKTSDMLDNELSREYFN